MKLRESKGRMFKSVSHTTTYFMGCSHACVYCWAKFVFGKGISHVPKLIQRDEFEVLDVENAVIFLNSAHDSLAECIPFEWVNAMLRWIGRQHPSNKFLIQTKNPIRLMGFLNLLLKVRDRVILGTTIETNHDMSAYSKAIHPQHRAWSLAQLREKYGFETFLSLEPLLDFHPDTLLTWIRAVNPVCIEIGLDGYKHKHKIKLGKPSKRKYRKFTVSYTHLTLPTILLV